jgi:hypothetical protein
MDEQKLTDMIDYFRGLLADEQLRLADAITTNQSLKRKMEEQEARLGELQAQKESNVSQEVTDISSLAPESGPSN